MQVSKVPATNSKGLSLVRFEQAQELPWKKTINGVEKSGTYSRLEFKAMDKQKKYTVDILVIGSYGDVRETKATDTVNAMGFTLEEDLDLDSLTSADEADDFADGTDEQTGEILDPIAQKLELFLDECKGKSYWVKLTVDAKGRYTLDPSTLVAFASK